MANEVDVGNLESVRKRVGKKKITTCSDEKPAPKKGAKKGAHKLKKKLSKRFAK
jgi:hypothetical protein